MISYSVLLVIPVLTLLAAPNLHAQGTSKKKVAEHEEIESINISVDKELRTFPPHHPGAIYSILLCADVPNNKKPYQVARHQQTGHVFLVMLMIDTLNSDTASQSFGFYPKRGLPTLFFKTIRSVIKDNSLREHDVYISRKLERLDFEKALSLSINEAKRIYHINKYNCYDYALRIFNAVAGPDTLPVTHVRFPFIFGRGGSPVGLYKDLERLKNNGSALAGSIFFGKFIAPLSSTRIIEKNKKILSEIPF